MPVWYQTTSAAPSDGGPAEAGSPAALESIRAYYEQNTGWFGVVQRRNQDLAIHRPVWADGITERQAALNYVNDQIAAHMAPVIQAGRQATLLDMGCGFGATLFYLAARFADEAGVTGVTISPQQAQLVHRRAATTGLTNCSVVEADFQAVPLATGIDALCSVEAFAHAFAPEQYMAEAARLLRPGGRLILCDDFRANTRPAGNQRATDARWIDLFQRGWHIPHLLSSDAVTDLACRHGLVKIGDTDFSPHLRMRAFPAAAIPLFQGVMDHGGPLAAIMESVLGGFALEECIRQGLVEYRFLVFEKQSSGAHAMR